MKEFIYLNTDYINSFLAQKHNGIPSSSEDETANELEESKKEHNVGKTIKRSYSLGVPNFLGFNNEIQPEKYEEINKLSNTKFGREMITKIMHDNSYDMFLEDSDSNKYTSIMDHMKVYDLTSLADIMENEFIDTFKLQTPSSEDMLNSLNRKDRRNPEIQKEAKKVESKNKDDLKNIKFAIQSIKLLAKLFPSDVYVYTQNYFIPFKRKFFREEIPSINYIYTSKTYIKGRVTGTIGNVLKHDDNNEFNAAINSLNDVGIEGLKLLGISEDAKILMPISWYNE